MQYRNHYNRSIQLKQFTKLKIYPVLSCLLLSACSSGGSTNGTANAETTGQAALTEITFSERTGFYSNRYADLIYNVDDVRITFASTDSNITFQVEVNRISSLEAASETPYQYYGYENNTIVPDEQIWRNPDALFGEFIGRPIFSRDSDEPNLPSGMCFLLESNEVVVALSVDAIATDGATLLLLHDD